MQHILSLEGNIDFFSVAAHIRIHEEVDLLTLGLRTQSVGWASILVQSVEVRIITKIKWNPDLKNKEYQKMNDTNQKVCFVVFLVAA